MDTKFVDLVGVELEGGWTTRTRPEGYCTDGSVTVEASWIGEVRSPALKLDDLLQWVTDGEHYPTDIDSSCGLHIHISSKDNDLYTRLMNQKFYDDFLSMTKEWAESQKLSKEHPFWPRWEGRNNFCRRNFVPDEQVMATDKTGARYTQLNYCHALHGTIENRMFPMFEKMSTAVSAIRTYVLFVDAWLKNNKKVAKDRKSFRMELMPSRREERISFTL